MNDNMDDKDLGEKIKMYLKANMKVLVEENRSGSECHSSKSVHVNVYIEGELISSSEIQELSFCH